MSRADQTNPPVHIARVMEDVSGSSDGESPVVREVIDLESDYEDDEDRVRQDMYEDFDELADLAVTASEEPPPPGTRVCPGFLFLL